MRSSHHLLLRASGLALTIAAGLVVATEVAAQDAPAPEDTTVVVTGVRASMRSSVQIKKNATEIVDSITAEDIGKLPDPNVAETLTRVPGVQGYRYGGEGASPVGDGSGLTIRGLSGQTASQVDGRSYFTAGAREFNIEDAIPGMVAGIDVYKNPSAEHIEGGIGGLVNIRTRHPSDFRSKTFGLGVTARYNDLAKELDPEVYATFADKWDLAGGGRIGVMAAAVYQTSTGRSDNNPANGGASYRRSIRADDAEYSSDGAKAAGANQTYAGRTDVWFLADVPTLGSPNANTPNLAANSFTGVPLTSAQQANIITAGGTFANVFQETIQRERKGLNLAADWVVNDSLRFYAGLNYTSYLYHQSYRFLQPSDSRTVQNLVTAPFALTESLANRNSNGGSDAVVTSQRFQSGTFLKSGLQTTGGDEHSPYVTWIAATGFEWQATDKLEVKGDFSYIKADRTQDNRSVTLAAASGLTWDITRAFSDNPHAVSFSGPSLTSPDTWYFNQYGNGSNQHWDDKGFAAAFDAVYHADAGVFTKVKFGARFAHQEDLYKNFGYGGKNLTTDGLGLTANRSNGISVASMPGLVEGSPTNWMRGQAGYSGGYLVFSPDALLGDTVRNNFPLAGIPIEGAWPEIQGARRFTAEDTQAVYVQGDFSAMEERLTGNIGLRAVNTNGLVRAFTSNPSTGVLTAIKAETSYTNLLPSANLIVHITPDTLLRLGYGKGLTRAPLGNLNPAVGVNTVTGFGNAGNPDLKPLIADSYDISFEKYFSKTNYISVDVFDKEIEGFFNGVNNCETVAGVPANTATTNGCSGGQYMITRTVNALKGNATGYELAFQSFLDVLPAPWSNFGASGSYTHVTTKNPVNFGSAAVPNIINVAQPFQSKDSYSLTGVYDDGQISARVVYTWRSSSILFGASLNPIDGRYIGAYGILDASFNYKINEQLTMSVNGSNLTDKGLDRFNGEPGLESGIERQHYLNGRTYSVALRYKFGG